MSVNILAPILKKATSVVVTIPMSELSPMQQKSFVNYLRTGTITGNGVPAIAAIALRRSFRLGFVQQTKNSHWTRWENLELHEMGPLIAAATAERITSKKDSTWSINDALNKTSSGSIVINHFTSEILNAMKIRDSPELLAYCDQIVAGKVNKIIYDAYRKES